MRKSSALKHKRTGLAKASSKSRPLLQRQKKLESGTSSDKLGQDVEALGREVQDLIPQVQALRVKYNALLAIHKGLSLPAGSAPTGTMDPATTVAGSPRPLERAAEACQDAQAPQLLGGSPMADVAPCQEPSSSASRLSGPLPMEHFPNVPVDLAPDQLDFSDLIYEALHPADMAHARGSSAVHGSTASQHSTDPCPRTHAAEAKDVDLDHGPFASHATRVRLQQAFDPNANTAAPALAVPALSPLSPMHHQLPGHTSHPRHSPAAPQALLRHASQQLYPTHQLGLDRTTSAPLPSTATHATGLMWSLPHQLANNHDSFVQASSAGRSLPCGRPQHTSSAQPPAGAAAQYPVHYAQSSSKLVNYHDCKSMAALHMRQAAPTVCPAAIGSPGQPLVQDEDDYEHYDGGGWQFPQHPLDGNMDHFMLSTPPGSSPMAHGVGVKAEPLAAMAGHSQAHAADCYDSFAVPHQWHPDHQLTGYHHRIAPHEPSERWVPEQYSRLSAMPSHSQYVYVDVMLPDLDDIDL